MIFCFSPLLVVNYSAVCRLRSNWWEAEQSVVKYRGTKDRQRRHLSTIGMQTCIEYSTRQNSTSKCDVQLYTSNHITTFHALLSVCNVQSGKMDYKTSSLGCTFVCTPGLERCIFEHCNWWNVKWWTSENLFVDVKRKSFSGQYIYSETLFRLYKKLNISRAWVYDTAQCGQVWWFGEVSR